MRSLATGFLLALLVAVPVAAQDTPAKVVTAEPEPAKALDAETKCLALAVYWEGKTETHEGQLAVAHTVLNRTKDPKFPNTVCGVVAQKAPDSKKAGGKKGCQFSWWCDGKRDEPKDDRDWQEAVQSARAALAGDAADPTKGALYFHSAKIRPPVWTKKRKNLGRIGDHVFYR
jgi:N-acetylmuramoyl-L-alanine amidase